MEPRWRTSESNHAVPLEVEKLEKLEDFEFCCVTGSKTKRTQVYSLKYSLLGEKEDKDGKALEKTKRRGIWMWIFLGKRKEHHLNQIAVR